MNEEHNNFEQKYDSFKDVAEFQNNMYNPGYYVGTGKVPPTVSAPGNAMPLAVFCFLAAPIILAFGLFLFFSDVTVTSMGLIESQIVNKIIALSIMAIISLFFLLLGVAYLKKAKRYKKAKIQLESETVDEAVNDEIWQRTCPECGKAHDIDYPKCPYCKFRYNE